MKSVLSATLALLLPLQPAFAGLPQLFFNPWRGAPAEFLQQRGTECGLGLTPKGDLVADGRVLEGEPAKRLRGALKASSVEGIERALGDALAPALRQDPAFWDSPRSRLTAQGCKAAVAALLTVPAGTTLPPVRPSFGAALMARIGRRLGFDSRQFDGAARVEPEEVDASAPREIRLDAAQVPYEVHRPLPPPPPPRPRGPAAVLARTAGAGVAWAGISAVSGLLYGAGAAAYFGVGSVLKSIGYSADLFPRPLRPVARFIGKHALGIRIAMVPALTVAGFATANPFLTYLAISFGTMAAGELAAKAAYKIVDAGLRSPPARLAGRGLDRVFTRFVHMDPPPPDAGIVKRAEWAAYTHRGAIARTVLASAISIGAVVGGFWELNNAMVHAQGVMATQNGSLSWPDRMRNRLIGTYRTMINPSGTVFQSGPNTRAFYLKMKAEYHPKTPQDWANIVDNEVTWTYHGDLYGTGIYHVTSEEASALRIYNGAPGYYSDCTGKAALLQNLLKMDGYGQSQMVIGDPLSTLWNNNVTGHVWLMNPKSDTPAHELFHYPNTMNLPVVERLNEAHGLRDNGAAALSMGGVGGLLGDLFYKGIESVDRRLHPSR